jgi:uncharacterized protein (TIGR02646 family)
MTFRKLHPKRSQNVPHKNNYRDYRLQLREDFGHRCGYCNDIDLPRVDRYEIDHFVPVSLDESKKTDYSNLVYACKSCNNSKSDKWPTNNPALSNNGTIGWIDPCTEDYANQFDRDKYGAIIPKTDIGKWMYENLKLWKSQHSYLWCIEFIGEQIDLIRANRKYIHGDEVWNQVMSIYDIYIDLRNRLYNL